MPDGEGRLAVEQQAVQVFQDAEASTYLVLDLQQVGKHPLLLLAFAAPADELLPVFTTRPADSKLLALLLAVTLLPNAP